MQNIDTKYVLIIIYIILLYLAIFKLSNFYDTDNTINEHFSDKLTQMYYSGELTDDLKVSNIYSLSDAIKITGNIPYFDDKIKSYESNLLILEKKYNDKKAEYDKKATLKSLQSITDIKVKCNWSGKKEFWTHEDNNDLLLTCSQGRLGHVDIH
jgi:hypothetical protein